MNITLSADEDVIAKARAAAQAQGTTLNDLIRRYMQQLGGQPTRQEVADELIRLIKENPGSPDPGFRFSREEIQRRVGQ